MMIMDEKLSAYVDGELSDDEMERIRGAIDSDPLLATRVDKLKQVDHLIASACAEIDNEQMPSAVLEMLQPNTNIRPTGNKENRGSVLSFKPAIQFSQRWRMSTMSMAASIIFVVAAGLGVQQALKPSGTESLLASNMIDQSNPLHHALERVASSQEYLVDLSGAITITPVLTFVSIGGDYCREFSLRTRDMTSRSVACRSQSGWKIQRTVKTSVQGSSLEGTYSTASSEIDEDFNAFVDDLMATSPLDAQEEAAIVSHHWQPAELRPE